MHFETDPFLFFLKSTIFLCTFSGNPTHILVKWKYFSHELCCLLALESTDTMKVTFFSHDSTSGAPFYVAWTISASISTGMCVIGFEINQH